MGNSFGSRLLGRLFLAIVLGAVSGEAADFGLGASGSPNPLAVNGTLTYTLTVTNISGRLLSNVMVTNLLPASAVFLSATNDSGSFANSAGVVTFQIDTFTNRSVAVLTLNVRVTAAGLITNAVSVAAANAMTEMTNLVIQVFSARADLGVTVTPTNSTAIVDDWVTYTLTTTNLGPDAASNVALSNALPAGVLLRGVAPASAVFTTNNGSLLFSVGTVANGASATYQVTIQPTNAGMLTLPASLSRSSALDTNAANDSASATLNVQPPILGQLTASITSTQRFNPQTGLLEQTIRITNVGTSAVASARVVLTGLTNWLFNAVGTNNGNPFVVYGSTLDTNQSVDLVLEYFIPTRSSVPDPVLSAYGVPAVNLTAQTNASLAISRCTLVPQGLLIEFQSVPGRAYLILYSDNASFTNALMAQPTIVAPADRVQWIDDGPPKTISRLADCTNRFYKVVQTQ
jgi:uncharacterized repeat protein (TIGR01451 family)